LLKPSECRHMGRGLAKSSYNFYSSWKSLIHSSSCSICSILGEWLVENVIGEGGGGGWRKSSECRHMGGEGLKLLKKNVIWYLNVPLSVHLLLLFVLFLFFCHEKRQYRYHSQRATYRERRKCNFQAFWLIFSPF